ncbi:MAG: HD domain-containing protein [Bacteriovoracia bacterium]
MLTNVDFTTPSTVLVADPDPQFAAQIRTEQAQLLGRRKTQAIAQTATTLDQALKLLADPKVVYSGIFINPKLAPPGGLTLFKTAVTHRAGIPLFLLEDTQPSSHPLDADQIAKLGIHRVLAKPVTYETIAALVVPLLSGFDLRLALGAARRDEPANEEVQAGDEEFAPVRAAAYISGHRSAFDVYVRLASGRYLKILAADDTFTPERLASYVRKGVEHLYIRREAQRAYLAYCDVLMQKLQATRGVTPEIRIQQTVHAGEQVLSFLRNQGVEPAAVRTAEHFVENMETLMSQLSLESVPEIKAFTRDIARYEHGVATTMIASILVRPPMVTSSRFAIIVGLAGLFHDIALDQEGLKLSHEDIRRIPPGKGLALKRHPFESAALLRKSNKLNPAILQAIEQHHERRNGKGFPLAVGAGSINLVSEVIGISDEFMHQIHRHLKNPRINPFQEMEQNIFDGFSFPVIEAFRKVFLRK